MEIGTLFDFFLLKFVGTVRDEFITNTEEVVGQLVRAEIVQNTTDGPEVAFFIVSCKLPRFGSTPFLNASLALHLGVKGEAVRDVEVDELYL